MAAPMRRPGVGHRAVITVGDAMVREIQLRRTARLQNAPRGDSDEETRSRLLGSNCGKITGEYPTD